MSITFTRAPTVTSGERPTSTQMAALSQAGNDRLLSGVADWAWRVSWYFVNLWRQVRNPDETGFAFPPQNEFFDIYCAVDPDHTDLKWPTSDAGEYEGANVANTMMQMVFGLDPTVDAEPDRYLDLWLYPAGGTKWDLWELGKLQRGGIDPAAGVKAWPAGSVAEHWMRIVSHYWSPHGKSYGGYLPTPEIGATAASVSGECGNSSSTGAGIKNWKHKFTATRDDVEVPSHHATLTTNGEGRSVLTYSGSCPCWTSYTATGHVVGVIKGGRSWYVYTLADASGDCSDFNVDVLSRDDWIEGPYSGYGELLHTDGEHLNRVVSAFAADYRGSDYQRAKDTFKIDRISFPFEEFMSRQYALAPAKGTLNPSGEFIDVEYPQAKFADERYLYPGSRATFTTGGQSYECSDGFVIAGVAAKATGLKAGCTINVLSNEFKIGELRLSPDDSGAASAMLWFTNSGTPQSLGFSLSSGASFDEGGHILLEAAELEEMKPQYWDAAMLCRVGAAGNGMTVDGRGRDVDTSKEIGDSILRNGCALGEYPQYYDQSVNGNPVYDVARRLTNQCLRILNRRQFVAYEVADGKSILYLKRFAYGLKNSRVDLLDGIAPQIDAIASGYIVNGERYIVDGAAGAITYAGATYRNGQTFTGTTETEFTTDNPDTSVYIYDGIKATALEKGWTNEWCSFVETKGYNPSETSIWKASAYSDYWAFCDRCNFNASLGYFNNAVRRHITLNYQPSVDTGTGAMDLSGDPYVPSQLYAPENPTGYRYIEGINQNNSHWWTTAEETQHHKSCRVYEPPINLESCTVHDRTNGIVKLTFSKRFHYHPSAPATWSATPPQWGTGDAKPAAVTALETETTAASGGYRTIDNALRSYHVHLANGHWNPSRTIGDTGELPSFATDAPYGCIYPTIFLVSLFRKPYEDGNNTTELSDTRMTIDELVKMEVFQRAGCEGWLDAAVTAEKLCELNPWPATGSGSMYDFTWESLNYQAHGGRGIGLMGTDPRPDNPEGFGPMPSTALYPEMFNRLAANMNLMTKARIPTNASLEYSYDAYTGSVAKTFTNGIERSVVAPRATTFYTNFTWTPGSGESRVWGNSDDVYNEVDSGEHIVFHRVVFDSIWEEAIPPDLLATINGYHGGFIAHVNRYYYTEVIAGASPGPHDEYCNPGEYSGLTSVWSEDGGATTLCWDALSEDTITCEAVPLGQAERPGDAPACDYRVASGRNNECYRNILRTPVIDDCFYVDVPLVDYEV